MVVRQLGKGQVTPLSKVGNEPAPKRSNGPKVFLRKRHLLFLNKLNCPQVILKKTFYKHRKN